MNITDTRYTAFLQQFIENTPTIKSVHIYTSVDCDREHQL